MSPALIHPAVAAIHGAKRLRAVPLSHVERALGGKHDDVLAKMAETPAYLAFEKSVSGPDGWPDPAEPIGLTQSADGEWWMISGLYTFLAAKRLGLAQMDAIFLRPSDVYGWQVALDRAEREARQSVSSEDDLYLRVASS